MLSQSLATGVQQLQQQLQNFKPDSLEDACNRNSQTYCQSSPHYGSSETSGRMGQALLGAGPKAAEADAPVIAFAAAAAQLLLQHIAEHVPADVSSALGHQLKQQVTDAAAEAAAAGRPFTITAALQQLLPQLSALAAQASHLGSMHAAAAVAAAAAMPAVLSTGGTGQLTRVDLSAPHSAYPPSQQQQQQQLPVGSPLSAQHSAALMHHSVACAGLPAAAAATGVLVSMHSLQEQQQQQQQQCVWGSALVPLVANGVYGAADVPQCSECGSTFE
jgi:hypothetical protein